MTEDKLKEHYPSILAKGYLYKDEFIDILKNEYVVKLK